MKIIGPFTQLLTMRNLNLKGALQDQQLEIIEHGAILVNRGKIIDFGEFYELEKKYPNCRTDFIEQNCVAIPGFIDCHTHICFAGDRANDYALRSSGKTYLEIAQNGGGIANTVAKTRAAQFDELVYLTINRANRHILDGVTTIEVKSGYGLNIDEELKILNAIKFAGKKTQADLIATCLAAHIKPKDFMGSSLEYLQLITEKLFPILKSEKLAKRIDIFVEKNAFSLEEARFYLEKARAQKFEITIHADQFSIGGSALAVEFKAFSADHLEASSLEEIELLANSDVVAVALPGATFGLGIEEMTDARALLDKGASLAIASDWNPGSAPMGDLLVQAAIFGARQKLSAAEIFSALTFRAAKALNLNDRGVIEVGKLGDIQLYPFSDYRQILYNQGKIKPFIVYKNGKKVRSHNKQFSKTIDLKYLHC